MQRSWVFYLTSTICGRSLQGYPRSPGYVLVLYLRPQGVAALLAKRLRKGTESTVESTDLRRGESCTVQICTDLMGTVMEHHYHFTILP